MSTSQEIASFAKVMKNLTKEIKRIEGATMKGLLFGAQIIREDMEKTPPLIPIGETGNLRASWFTTSVYIKNMPILLLGFSAEYAVYVDEMVGKGKKINWSRPDSGPKFFEASIKRNKNRILEEIRRAARIL